MDIDISGLASWTSIRCTRLSFGICLRTLTGLTGSVAPGICPCLTPTMVPFVTNRGGPLVGIEALSLQGIPVDDLLLTRENENQMSDLAGNAMTTTVVGACMLAAMTLMTDTLAGKKHKTAKRALKLDDAFIRQYSDNARVFDRRPSRRCEERGSDGSRQVGQKAAGFGYEADSAQGVAQQSEQICTLVCLRVRLVPRTPILSSSAVTVGIRCIKCCGRPEHNYTKHVVDRILPEDFKEQLKNSFADAYEVGHKLHEIHQAEGNLARSLEEWQNAMKAIGEGISCSVV